MDEDSDGDGDSEEETRVAGKSMKRNGGRTKGTEGRKGETEVFILFIYSVDTYIFTVTFYYFLTTVLL